MNKAIVMPAFSNFEELENLLKELSEYEGQVIVIDSHPDHEKKHLVRHLVRHNVYLPLNKDTDATETINKFLKNIQRKWILIMNADSEIPNIDSLDKMSLYDNALFKISD